MSRRSRPRNGEVIEAFVALDVGLPVGSVALVGFGVNSGIE